MSETNDSGQAETGPAEPSAGKARRRSLLGGLIATSKATTPKVDLNAASMKARTCGACGAGRPEDTDIRVCAYCGERFMSDEVDPGGDLGSSDIT